MISYRVTAQKTEFLSLYKGIFERVKSASSFSTDCKIDIYLQDTPVGNKPSKTVEGSMKLMQGACYYNIYKMEYLYTKKISILLDHNNKRVVYSEVEQDADKVFKKYAPSLDSLLAKNDSVKLQRSASGQAYYTIYSSKNTIFKTDLYIDASQVFISKLVYYYNPKIFDNDQSVVITYHNTKINDDTIKLPLLSKFIFKKGGKYIPTAPYSSYSITEVKKL